MARFTVKLHVLGETRTVQVDEANGACAVVEAMSEFDNLNSIRVLSVQDCNGAPVPW